MLSGVESSFWTPYFLDTYLAEKCLKHFIVQGNKFIVEKILLGVEKMTRTERFARYVAFQQKHIQNPFKHLRWSVFACPVNDFKPLTVCTKTLHLRCLKSF